MDAGIIKHDVQETFSLRSFPENVKKCVCVGERERDIILLMDKTEFSSGKRSEGDRKGLQKTLKQGQTAQLTEDPKIK